jgi:glycosyltransferase involved in cell wall biosynthesis
MVHIKDRPKIAIFVSFSGKGGVERMIINLCEGLCSLGCEIDLVLVKAQSEHLNSLHTKANIVKLGSSHTMSSLLPLVRYLRCERPAALLAAKDRANQVGILARRIAGVSTRVVVRMGTTVSAALAGKSPMKEYFWYLRMRLLYPFADAVVAVSRGVAADLRKNAKLSPSHLQVIENPVITPQLIALGDKPANHPWLSGNGSPVIVGVGRLTHQKDFPTLIRAFAAVHATRPCRLVLLGEGRDRAALQSLINRLGITADVDMPGFVVNPYAYMSRATVFALSSAWEGSPNALTEALALGTPVVSTDCRSGPREILENGRYGALVPVGDVDALAKAILSTMANPPEKSFLRNAVRAYTVEMSSKRYLETLLGVNHWPSSPDKGT